MYLKTCGAGGRTVSLKKNSLFDRYLSINNIQQYCCLFAVVLGSIWKKDATDM